MEPISTTLIAVLVIRSNRAIPDVKVRALNAAYDELKDRILRHCARTDEGNARGVAEALYFLEDTPRIGRWKAQLISELAPHRPESDPSISAAAGTLQQILDDLWRLPID